jgi:hypothetical protein
MVRRASVRVESGEDRSGARSATVSDCKEVKDLIAARVIATERRQGSIPKGGRRMTKHQLARELRRRQYALGEVERWMIDGLCDDEIIDSYITYSCCGEKQVDARQLETAIAQARGAEHFFRICNRLSKRSPHPKLRRFPDDSNEGDSQDRA